MPWQKNKSGGYRTRKGGNVADPHQYETLRKQGLSKESAARITNANQASKTRNARKSGNQKK